MRRTPGVWGVAPGVSPWGVLCTGVCRCTDCGCGCVGGGTHPAARPGCTPGVTDSELPHEAAAGAGGVHPRVWGRTAPLPAEAPRGVHPGCGRTRGLLEMAVWQCSGVHPGVSRAAMDRGGVRRGRGGPQAQAGSENRGPVAYAEYALLVE